MAEKEKDNILKIPVNMSSVGPVDDVTEAYLKSILALPDLLKDIGDSLAGIDASLSVVSLYLEKKGMAEGIIHPDDIERGGDNGPRTES